MRCSPPVRMHRSGSGWSPVTRQPWSARGDIVHRQVPALDPAPGAVRPGRCPTGRRSWRRPETGIAGSGGFRFAHGRLQLRMETRAIADDAQADTVLVDAHLAAQGHEKQLHQRADFVRRTLPVLAGEREQGEDLDPCLGADPITALTASTPACRPATPGRRRFFAQRLLPSMIMATWRGTHTSFRVFSMTSARPQTAMRSALWLPVPSRSHR